MARSIIAVGIDIPGEDIEFVEYTSPRSLLDADIVFFAPQVPFLEYTHDTYQGKKCLSDDYSFRAKEAVVHWRRELSAALDAGKLVLLLLKAPQVVFAATGQKTYSGTGRNARATRIVAELSSYEAIPVDWKFLPAAGSEMVPSAEAKFFLPFWSQFFPYMEYELYLECDLGEKLLTTKSGTRVVSACLRKGKGALVAIPVIGFQDDDFTEVRGEGVLAEEYWTDKALAFGKKLVAAACAMAAALASEVNASPPPEWTHNEEFQLPMEASILAEIGETIRMLGELDQRKRGLDDLLARAGSLRSLLFEQGKPLELAVLEALTLFGFDASSYDKDGSEFDAVFTSSEGRFLGEVEGKDSRPINIDKFSQLERNLSEDFQRDDVLEHAKGVLFGNAFRLRAPKDRGLPFTAKCLSAAARLRVALVSTPDLFAPAKYLKSIDDPEYAAACRRAILETSGEIVQFPPVPGDPSDRGALEDKRTRRLGPCV